MLPFAVAAVITLLLVRSAHLHARHTGDSDLGKPQKMHLDPVPRIGGLAIVLGLLVGAVWVWADGRAGAGDEAAFGLLLLVCALPVFGAGLAEDLARRIAPRWRLAAAAVSSALAFVVLDAGLVRVAIPGIDWIIGFTFGSLVLTMFTVTGISHAVNIIDGFNGLASMCVMLMLGAIAYVAFLVGDPTVGVLAVAGIGAVLGFFVWNYPRGLIFLGDGGAYFLGFWVAELAILLIVRNPQVSPLFPLLVCVYPVFETLFSIYRRWLLRARPAHMPDGIHLHTLIYRRVMRWALGDRSGARAQARRNSRTSPVLWLLCMASIVPATLWWPHTAVMAWSLLAFAVAYVALYWRIVRFRAPRLLRLMGSRPMPLRPHPPPGDNRGT